MQLLYSGATSPNALQTSPSLSIGGFVSSSAVRNNFKNGVFSPLRLIDIKNLCTQARLIVLKNETGVAINDISIWIVNDPNSPAATYQGGLVLPAVDNCGNPSYEKLFSDTDLPLNAVLTPIIGEGDALELSSLAAGATIGLWLIRTIDTTNMNYFDNSGNFILNTCDMTQQAATVPSYFYNVKVESISIKIQYT